MQKHLRLLLLPILTLILLPVMKPAFADKAPTLQKQANGVIVHLPDGYLNVRFFSDSIVHVQFAKDRQFFKHKTLDVVGRPDNIHWLLEPTDSVWNLHSKKLTVSIDRANGKIKFLDNTGQPILTELNRELEPYVIQGEKTFHLHQQWEPHDGESLYGLGQEQIGTLDLKGYDLDLWQHNTNVAVPFLVSSLGYGIFWENPSYTRFGALKSFVPIPANDLLDKSGHPGGLTAGSLDGSGPVSITADICVTFHGQNWNDHAPATRWEGSLLAPTSGDYQFRCTSNGGVKVWIDGNLVIDHWRQKWLAADEQVKMHLEAEKPHPIRIEWTTEQGTILSFRWKTPEQLSSPAEQSGFPTSATPIMIDTNSEKISYFVNKSTVNYSSEKNNSTDGISLWSEMGKGIDYYFVYGPGLDKVVAGYRALTGQAPMMPAWAFGLWQSRQRYETAQQSLDAVDGFRKRGIPFDNIVQDWMYWRKDSWGSHQFDPERFPDPDGWLKSLHDKHAHVMISVWGKYYPGTDNFKAMQSRGFLYQPDLKEGIKDWLGFPYTFYDAFNPKARKAFWGQINSALFQKGIDAWWMDATEPDLMPSPPTLEGQEAHLNPTALGPGAKVLNAYPLENSIGIYEGQRAAAPNQRVFILTRSGYAGSQRTASAIWSGDITSTWTALAKQIPAGLNFSLSGIPYWTTDTGGYTMQWKFANKNPKPEDDEEWRELNARWFEFSTFCPLLRVHGELRPREMWTLGSEDSPAYQAELKFDRLRYRLFPYLYSTAWAVTKNGETFMRPLVMDFPADNQARNLTDEYMFGKAFLVAPITHYKARSRQVYLPNLSPDPSSVASAKEEALAKKDGALWYDFWTGRQVKPGSLDAPAPYDAIPLFVRAGSIIPFGPELQYIGEKPQDPITLFLYAGADGDFTLYEDDGLTYGYEKGAYSEIPIHWDDEGKTLTLGDRSGQFKGMLDNRTLNVVLVSKDKAVGFSFEPQAAQSLAYDGRKLEITLK